MYGTRTLLDVSRALIRLGLQLFAVSGKFKRLTVCELHRALRVGPNGSDCLTGPYGTCAEQSRSVGSMWARSGFSSCPPSTSTSIPGGRIQEMVDYFDPHGLLHV